jgi:hypothetical protein
MEPTYVVINQLGQYLNKHKAWISGRDSQLVYRTVHKDEALNFVFEMSSKDTELRARVLAVDLDEKNQPVIEPGPISEAEIQKELKLEDAEENDSSAITIEDAGTTSETAKAEETGIISLETSHE